MKHSKVTIKKAETIFGTEIDIPILSQPAPTIWNRRALAREQREFLENRQATRPHLGELIHQWAEETGGHTDPAEWYKTRTTNK